MCRLVSEVINSEMRKFRTELERRDSTLEIDAGIADFLDRGVVLTDDGMLLFGGMGSGALASRSRFEDEIALEAFVNKIYLSDWLVSPTEEIDASFLLAQGLLLADRVAFDGTRCGVCVTIILLLQPQEHDLVFRFHRSRVGLPSWLGNIEAVEVPVMIRVYCPEAEVEAEEVPERS